MYTCCRAVSISTIYWSLAENAKPYMEEFSRPIMKGDETVIDKYKVVFHIDEQAKASLVLHNISNLITDIGGDNLGIEMVANSDAVKVLIKIANEFEPILKELAEKQVVFCACTNAMNNFGIQKDELLDFVTVVPSGVGEIVKKSAEQAGTGTC